MARRSTVGLGGLCATAITVTMLATPSAPAVAADRRPEVDKAKAVTLANAKPHALAPLPADHRAARDRLVRLADQPVAWPQAQSATVTGSETKTLGPIEIRSRGGSSATRVRVLDQAAARQAGVDGVLVELSRPEGGAGDLGVTVDYADFAHAFGGAWGSRLAATAYPTCLAVTPDRPACQESTPLRSKNDTDTNTLSANVPADSLRSGSMLMVVEAAAASSGGTGDFSATPLSASSSWTAGGSSGDFNWSYPFRTVPSNGGPAPELALSYSSQSVDGRTAATNNQSSWVGEGFDLSSSYVERGYVSCNDDGHSGKYDQCWKTDNASLVLNGQANELVKAADGTWKLGRDDGSRVRRLTSTSTYNLDNDKEYWEVTTAQGTKYYFGRTTVPGQTGDTKSVWYAPVFGDDAGEPCHGSTFASSSCNQAWRWNLDYVVDPHGNAMSYWYTAETNNYAKNKVASPGTKYIRGGYLNRIDYGLRDGATNTNPPMRVTFTNAVRCLAETGCSDYSKAKWPDTPYDEICDDGKTCTGKFGPTFFTRYRLTKITTQVRKAAAYTNVDSWTLRHDFLDSGTAADGTLWLAGITHAGHVGGTVTLPELTLGAVQLTNRVDTPTDGISALPRFRIRTITSETGALTTVNYSAEQCTAASKPTPDSNTQRCFPQKWTPEGNTSPRTDWFHKYVVDEVSEADPTTLGETKQTFYTYSGGGAWAYNNDKLVEDKYRTWSIWRGYGTVKTVTGSPQGTQSQEVSTYFRGMEGDKQESGTPRSASVVDSEGTSIVDKRAYAGFKRESITYTKAGGTEYTGVISTPWSKVTAGSGAKTAFFLGTTKEESRAVLSGGGMRRGRATTTFDDTTGLPTRVSNDGDLAVAGDEMCEATVYANALSPTGAWMVGFASRRVSSTGLCGADALTPAEGKVLSDTRTRYDNLGQGVAPTKGLVTQMDRLKAYVSGAPQYQTVGTTKFDGNGRPIEVSEPLDGGMTRVTTTVYNQTTDGTLGSTVETLDSTGKAFKTTTTFATEWGQPTKIEDPNLKVTEAAYDAMGRLVSVWATNRARTATPSTKYDYVISKTAPSAVTTSTLNTDGTGYRTSVALYDALLRPRQSQSASPAGGRIITGTAYDSRGLAVQSMDEVYATGSPSTTLAQFSDGIVPALTKATYDGLGRMTKETLYTFNTERWSTNRTYTGSDRVRVDPPAGAPASTTISDIRGQVTRSIEHGTPDLVTDRTYDLRGNLTKIVSPGGTWTYTFDLRNRMIASTDPDAGAADYTYTENDLIRTSKDARGKQVLSKYDSLDRRIAMYEGAAELAEKQLAGWTFDTPAKGYPTTSTRYIGGATGDKIESRIVSYNATYKVAESRLSVTPADGSTLLTGLPTSLTRTTVYNVDQSIDVDYLPRVSSAAGTALSMEPIQYTYNGLGMPTAMQGRSGIVQDVVYDQLGRGQQMVLGAGPGKRVYQTQTYDEGTGRLTRSLVTSDLSSNVVSDHQYTYDDSGNPLKDANAARNDTQCFDYDDHRRLENAWTPANGDCSAAPTQQLLGGPAPYWQSWTFTDAGHRRTQTTTTPTDTVTDTYTYPAATAPHRNFASTIDRATSSGTVPRTYTPDNSGNTVSRPGETGPQTLEWDSEGNLSKLTESSPSGAKETRYVYSVDGDLLLRDGPDEKVLIAGETEIRIDKTNGNTLSATRNYSTPVGPVATRSSDTKIHFLVADAHGTSGVALDGDSLVPTYRYEMPYGEKRGATPVPSWPNSHSFLDKVEDLETGLISVGARQYDAGLGRFVSVDPHLDHGSPAQMLGYSYANNNPQTYSDPTGRMYTEEGGGGGSWYTYLLQQIIKYTIYYYVTSLFGGSSSSYSTSSSSSSSDDDDDDGGFSLGGLVDGTVDKLKGAGTSAKNFAGGAFAGTVDLLPSVSGMGHIACGSFGPMAAACADSPAPSNSELLENSGAPWDTDTWEYKLGYILGIPTPTGGGLAASGGRAGVKALTRLFSRLMGRSSELTVAEVTARLQGHVDRAVQQFNNGTIKMSTRQERKLDDAPELYDAFRGQVIDRAVKNAVSKDKKLKDQLWVSRSGEFGPDFHDVLNNTWWDVTTPGQWKSHVNKYSSVIGDSGVTDMRFGGGIPLYTK